MDDAIRNGCGIFRFRKNGITRSERRRPAGIQRFEQIGIHSFDELAQYDALTIAEMVADMLNTTCWKNSPQARAAVAAAIARAQVGL